MTEGWMTFPIIDLVEPIETYDPGKEPELIFTYIDVSSVSRESLAVTKPARVLGSKAPSRARRVVRAGDVIFATIRPTLSRVAQIPIELDGSICSTGFFVLRPKNIVLGRFLYYWLLGEAFSKAMETLQKGASYPAVSDSDVKNQLAVLPPLPEQKRIVGILDEAFAGIDAAIANTQKNLANARELFESYLNSVFSQRGEGWHIKPVREFAENCLGKMLDKQKNKGEMRPYLRNVNVRWFNVRTDDVLEMRIEEHEEQRFAVKAGDLLICEGGYPGRAAIWDGSESVFFQKALHRVRCNDQRYNRWLMYYLHFTDANGKLAQHFTGAGIQHFTGKALNAFPVPVPPSILVEKLLAGIEAVYDEVMSLEVIYQKKLTALADLGPVNTNQLVDDQ